MGDAEPAGALRFSLGPASTPEEIDQVLQALPAVLEGVRKAADWA